MNFFSTKKKEIKEPEKYNGMTVGELAKGKNGFKINFSKLQENIKKCELNKDKNTCKKEFEDLGIEFFENG